MIKETLICKECGKVEEYQQWNHGDQLKKKELCFSCDFWMGYLMKKDKPESVRVKGTHYWIGDENSSATRFRGFGGAKWVIKFNDGRVVKSTNLWCQSDIPDHFKDRLPDNAEFVHNQRMVR